jgi:short-subunit dehydrogenase
MAAAPASPVVVVSGGSAGLGLAVARAFAERGARIGILARDRDRLATIESEMKADGYEVLGLPVDVARYKELLHAAQRIESELGPIDVWINSAMVTVFARFSDMRPREFRRITEVTYLGTVNGTRVALERMGARDRGVIVQVGSALARRSIPLQSAYCGAKHAIAGFTESVRCELIAARSHIEITMVQLPALNTPQFDWAASRLRGRPQPVPPIFQPEVAARAIVRAARHPRKEVWLGWPTARAILATRVAGSVVDRWSARRVSAEQESDELDDPTRPVNLWEPVAGEPTAHGRFDACARRRSLVAAVSKTRLLAATGALAAALGSTLTRRVRTRRPPQATRRSRVRTLRPSRVWPARARRPRRLRPPRPR